MIKVSLIIPVYNKAAFLERCLDSVVSQISKSIEVIIINDGSTDDSGEICNEYCTKYGFQIYHTENKGVSEARNLGINKSQGEYIAFLDADDVLAPKAIQAMLKEADRGYNICQFGQYRFPNTENVQFLHLTIPYRAEPGFYYLNFIPKYWVLVWNKLYKRSFLENHKIKFKKGMQFGEDALFNAECILANGGLYHAPQATVIHIWDDKNSLCRGDLTVDKLELLDQELTKLAKKQTDPEKITWMKVAISEHRNSRLFRRYGVGHGSNGEYDIVYFVKDKPTNEELVYSLRSVEQNWSYKNVWFCGGCPDNLIPDKHLKITPSGLSKWDRVRNMIIKICQNDEITSDFWLFNDDFFVLKPMADEWQPLYNGELLTYIERIERKHGPDEYTERLHRADTDLKIAGMTTRNYEVHKPMLINRKKALEVLYKFPSTPAFRSLYGNYWNIGGNDRHDMKIKLLVYNNMNAVENFWDFVSTDDFSFRNGEVGKFIRQKFNNKSRFEK